jgi:chromosomal replication initiation ATPase DnaA
VNCPEKKDVMNKDFEQVMNAVANAMDLRPCQILCKRRFQESTNARWMVVYLLHERGYCSARIAEWMGMTARNVNAILHSMSRRVSQEDAICRFLEIARKYLH